MDIHEHTPILEHEWCDCDSTKPTHSRYTAMPDEEVQKVFAKLDTDGNGRLDCHEFKRGLKELGLPTNSKDIHEMMGFEEDPNRRRGERPYMTFDAFRKFVRTREDLLHDIFIEMDTDGSGQIDIKEMSRAIKKYNANISPKDYAHIHKRMDKNADAMISFDEFREALLLLPQLQAASMFDHWSRTSIDIGESLTIPEDVKDWNEQRKMLIAGVLAGSTSRTVTAPLDRLKVMLQVEEQHLGVWRQVQSIFKEGGLRGFWRGNAANVLKMGPELGIRFWAFYEAKKFIAADPNDCTIAEKLASGAIAGMISQTTVYPLETIKVRMAIAMSGTYNGITDCATKLYSPAGFRGLFKGYTPCMLGVVPYCGIDLAMYSSFKEYFIKKYPDDLPKPHVLLACGAISSCCGQIVAYPFQLVRTRMQAQGAIGMAAYTGMMQCLRHVLQQDGVLGLYHGMQANFLKTLPAVSVSRLVDDWARRTF